MYDCEVYVNADYEDQVTQGEEINIDEQRTKV